MQSDLKIKDINQIIKMAQQFAHKPTKDHGGIGINEWCSKFLTSTSFTLNNTSIKTHMADGCEICYKLL